MFCLPGDLGLLAECPCLIVARGLLHSVSASSSDFHSPPMQGYFVCVGSGALLRAPSSVQDARQPAPYSEHSYASPSGTAASFS